MNSYLPQYIELDIDCATWSVLGNREFPLLNLEK